MSFKLRTGWFLSMMALSTLVACGGSDDPPSSDSTGSSMNQGGGGSGAGEPAGACGELAACGGDPTGSWTIEESCLDLSFDIPPSGDCVPVSDISRIEINGEFEFDADETYTATLTVGGTIVVTFPAPCFSGEDMALTCADLGEQLSENEAGGIESVDCAPVGDGCACTMAARELTSASAGTWSASGTTLTTVSEDDEASEGVPFCVDGSTLTMDLPAAQDEQPDAGSPSMKGYLRLRKN
ncbi:hypothetical protein [Sorangium sp. So ce1097]|uniref:hypothetical protein n=1 Tax=Sorangium sp. So ce1097 TaxID=3133330 RepID=UPI003F61E213